MEIGLSAKDIEHEPADTLDYVQTFQKSAIYRQCLEYKRLYTLEVDVSHSLRKNLEGIEGLLAQVLTLGNFKDFRNLKEISNFEEFKKSVLNSNVDFDKLSSLQQNILKLERENQEYTRKNDEFFSENLKLNRTIDRLRLSPSNKISNDKNSILDDNMQKERDNLSANSEITDKKLTQELESLREDLKIKQESLENAIQEKRNLAQKITDLSAKEILNQGEKDKISQLELVVLELKQQVQVNKDKYFQSLDKIQDLEGKEREFQGTIIKQEQEKRKKIISDFKKIEGDNARLRKERDSFKHKYDLKCVKDGEESKVNQELKVLMNCQRERIQTLEMDISRLLGLVSHESGDKVLEEFFMENGSKNPIKDWKDQVEVSQNKIKELESVLSALENPGLDEQQQAWLEKEKKYLKRIEDLEKVSSQYKNYSESESISYLQAKDQEVMELKNKIEYFNKAQSGLLKEIENLGKSWADLEAQNTKKIFNLSSIEELKIKHKEDKLKLEQKCSLLSRQSATVDNARIALKKQCEKQSEMIIKQQEREKAVSEQLMAFEKENAARGRLLVEEKLKVSELMAQISSFEAQNMEINKKCENMLSLVRSRSEALESESAAKLQVQEQVASLTKKLDILNKDGDANLREQLQDYKLLLKCSSCNNRFKSHALLKCMHVFCKECLDDMYNSRQRKCPSCSLPFGHLDIKQIFL